MNEPLRTIFFGTPDFAVPTLRRLATDPHFTVLMAVTQPDRPSGRGQNLEAPPVKRAASELGIESYQPAALRDAAARQPLINAGADLFVVAAYGLIFGRRTLAIPAAGCLNVHASLLPHYRGASPVTAAILNGDDQTGVSLMVMEPGLDTGPVVAAVATALTAEDTAASLTSRLADLGAELAATAIPGYAAGERQTVPQAPGGSLTRPLMKVDGWLDWTRPAADLERQVRAMWPWPRAWTTLNGQPLQIHEATVNEVDDEAGQGAPGTARLFNHQLIVACGSGSLRLVTVQPSGGRPMPSAALVQGRRLAVGDRLGTFGAPPAAPPLITPVFT